MPSFAKVTPSVAPSAASRMSQGSDIVTPTPIAGPLIATITGLGKRARSRAKPFTKCSSPSGTRSSPCAMRAACSFMNLRSTPAQKARPAPLRITARIASSSRAAPKACTSSSPIRGW